MISPGFEIYNDTIWPLQVSLNQAGPLYYGLVPPNGYFHRRTGAVWFTINTSISLDNQLHINDWKCVWPVAAVVATVAMSALTGGNAAFSIAGMRAANLGNIHARVAGRLSNGGLEAQKALVIEGVAMGDLSPREASAALARMFDSASAEVSKRGCYSGPPWPFRRNVHTYRVTGGPYLEDIGNDQVELIYRKLYLD